MVITPLESLVLLSKNFPYLHYSLCLCPTLMLSEMTELCIYCLSLSLKGKLPRALGLSYLLLYLQDLEHYRALSSARLVTEQMCGGDQAYL